SYHDYQRALSKHTIFSSLSPIYEFLNNKYNQIYRNNNNNNNNNWIFALLGATKRI
ncbi:MAG: hypothetical protein ACI8RD_012320, partial [Bacillariaceae sp.]